MDFSKEGAQIYIPDGVSLDEALERATHFGIGTHPDDLELLALPGIMAHFEDPKNNWFFGIVAGDGVGIPRPDGYDTDHDYSIARAEEQKRVAFVGQYSGVALLNYPSSDIKHHNPQIALELKGLIEKAQPKQAFIHDVVAEQHETHKILGHISIEVLRQLDAELRDNMDVYGGEVWGSLEWLNEADRVVFDVSKYYRLAGSLLHLYVSQLRTKPYDDAFMARMRARATFREAHEADQMEAILYAIDMTPLIRQPTLDVVEFVQGFYDRAKEKAIE